MRVIHTNESLEVLEGSSVFLAGPTPRSGDVLSWRPRALELIDTGWTVLVPEARDWVSFGDYQDQVEWEYEALSRADVILFWVPRELQEMPGFTTNVEFGWWLQAKPQACVLGHPNGAPKTRYLDWLA